MKELERISGTNGLREQAQSKWVEITNNIIFQANLESRNRSVRDALDMCKDFEGIECLCMYILLSFILYTLYRQ